MNRIIYKTDHGQTPCVLPEFFIPLSEDIAKMLAVVFLVLNVARGSSALLILENMQTKSKGGILSVAVNVIHTGINTQLTQTGLRFYHRRHRPITAIVWVCVSECACVLAEGSFSVTGRIAGIVAEQVSTQVSWVRPAAEHVGNN